MVLIGLSGLTCPSRNQSLWPGESNMLIGQACPWSQGPIPEPMDKSGGGSGSPKENWDAFFWTRGNKCAQARLKSPLQKASWRSWPLRGNLKGKLDYARWQEEHGQKGCSWQREQHVQSLENIACSRKCKWFTLTDGSRRRRERKCWGQKERQVPLGNCDFTQPQSVLSLPPHPHPLPWDHDSVMGFSHSHA